MKLNADVKPPAPLSRTDGKRAWGCLLRLIGKGSIRERCVNHRVDVDIRSVDQDSVFGPSPAQASPSRFDQTSLLRYGDLRPQRCRNFQERIVGGIFDRLFYVGETLSGNWPPHAAEVGQTKLKNQCGSAVKHVLELSQRRPWVARFFDSVKGQSDSQEGVWGRRFERVEHY
jgi:hypothetical protein